MFRKIKHSTGNHLINIRGWRTNRKIVVIESDDWGTIRMPDRTVRNELLPKYPELFNLKTYDRIDNLANSEDLSALFEVLIKYRDFKGNHPVFTANTIVANPDFSKIKLSGYSEYHYELFTETLSKYPSHQGTFEIWKQGIDSFVFKPLYHGREHLNVPLWMNALQENQYGVRDALNKGTWTSRLQNGKRLDVAFNYENEVQLQFMLNSISEGAKIFEKVFGYRSTSFIAPSYTWCDNIETRLGELGIKYLQGGLAQVYPQKVAKERNQRTKWHYTGQRNMTGQIYLMRNVHFEPALAPTKDSVKQALDYIDRVFWWNKPAIISSHRLNYIGNIEPENRNRTLEQLDLLLSQILKKYPDVEFISSDELGDLISGE